MKPELPKGHEICPRCGGSGCYDCGYFGHVPEAEADYLLAEDDCDFDDDY